MLALSPPVFEWNESTSHYINDNNNDISCTYKHHATNYTSQFHPLDDQLIGSSQPQSQELLQWLAPSSSSSPSPSPSPMAKKLHHNASERDRRKKINTLYSSLRSMLPLPHQSKKLSIPATIGRVLKYIPELEEEVEALKKKKEELLLMRIKKQADDAASKDQCPTKTPQYNNSANCLVSTTILNETQAVIHISTLKLHQTTPLLLSDILLCLQNQGLSLLNASSFHTFGGRIFYTLHFQVDKTCRLETDILSDKLLSMYEKKELGVFNFNASKHMDGNQIISVL